MNNKNYKFQLSDNNICEVYYDEINDEGDHFTPPYYSIEINKITLNGDDVTDRMETFYDEIVSCINENNN
tara:strand:+ start:6647 stop:6856 length:210 start_codon:yes stop_codon:yes gene_type:complete